jgi:hypothetical protein
MICNAKRLVYDVTVDNQVVVSGVSKEHANEIVVAVFRTIPGVRVVERQVNEPDASPGLDLPAAWQ